METLEDLLVFVGGLAVLVFLTYKEGGEKAQGLNTHGLDEQSKTLTTKDF